MNSEMARLQSDWVQFSEFEMLPELIELINEYLQYYKHCDLLTCPEGEIMFVLAES